MDFHKLAPAWARKAPTRGICPRCGKRNDLISFSFPADEPCLSYRCQCGAQWDEHYHRSGSAVLDERADRLILVQDLPTLEHPN